MSAVLPFLRDRCELSLQLMQHFHLEIEVQRGKSQTSGREGWARTCAELPNSGSLNLAIRIHDLDCRYAWKLKLGTKKQHWVHEMVKNIINQDKLGTQLTPNEEMKEDSPTQELLSKFLAPKMLKKVGDEPHDARSLLKRRIRDD
ncbi:MAG: hypothetical protein Q9161_004741 [Pseudevernia consocians]